VQSTQSPVQRAGTTLGSNHRSNGDTDHITDIRCGYRPVANYGRTPLAGPRPATRTRSRTVHRHHRSRPGVSRTWRISRVRLDHDDHRHVAADQAVRLPHHARRSRAHVRRNRSTRRWPRAVARSAGPAAAASLRSRRSKAFERIGRRTATERVDLCPLRAPELDAGSTFTSKFTEGIPFVTTTSSLAPISRPDGTSKLVEITSASPTASTPIRLWPCVRK
jgi:hypothetical protein